MINKIIEKINILSENKNNEKKLKDISSIYRYL